MIKEEDGKVHIVHKENVEPVIEAAKQQRDMLSELSSNRSARYVGTVPGTVARQWQLECGAAPGTREFSEYVKKKFLSGDYSKLVIEGY